ncbi:inorganic phosphate transporter, partial [Pseudomonas syringae pv. tagetis]
MPGVRILSQKRNHQAHVVSQSHFAMTMSIFFQPRIANKATNALSHDATGRASLSATQFGRKPGRMT